MPNPALISAGLDVAKGVVNTGMGLILQRGQDKRQLKQQRKLQELQIKGQKELADYSYEQQMKMWEATNYDAQKAQMKKAGLNPGLMYGMGGGGGQTTGTAPSTSVSGGTAAGHTGEVQAMLAMGLQRELQKAQIDNIKAQTEQTKAETTKTTGVDTREAETRILDLTQGIENKKAQRKLTEVQTDIAELEQELKGKSMQDVLDRIDHEERIAAETMDRLNRENIVDKATMYDRVDMVKAQLLTIGIQNALTRAQTDKTRSDIQVNNQTLINMSNKIVQEWRALEIAGLNQTTEARNKEHQNWVNDIQQSTGLPIEVVSRVLQAVILKQAFKTEYKPVTGFR